MSVPELPALCLPGYVDGIDVSRVQTITDPAAVYAAGFRFAFAKASEGTGYRDPAARRHLDALSAAGLLVGAYGFARVSLGQPREQARLAYDAATSDGRHVVRMALDLESCPAGTPWAYLRDFAIEWVDEMRGFGSMPVLYTMASWLGPLGATALEVPVWVAQYRSTTRAWAPDAASVLPGVWDLWQYSGDGGHRVAGIPQDCDRNLLRTDDLRGWFGLPSEPTYESDSSGVAHGTHVVDAALEEYRRGED